MKRYNSNDPLFVRFANGDINQYEVVKSVAETTQDSETKEIATKALDKQFLDIGVFQTDFKNCVKDITEFGITHRSRSFLDSYLSSSLLLFRREQGLGGTGSVETWYRPIGEGTPWVEGAICFNLASFIRSRGSVKEIKSCKTCSRIFVHKGEHAVYCSESCKAIGGGNK